ncbi:uncharacterized protein LOC131316640 [Rhododendron vialii]|uniref:uncharacterized protein LOC131316640 n=1 Tax=Rhododendron vialii TaxID=182163 RepID=UPI00265EA841|nr:uncharacterized protein LOC131316640 [Rhododendron vialii]
MASRYATTNSSSFDSRSSTQSCSSTDLTNPNRSALKRLIMTGSTSRRAHHPPAPPAQPSSAMAPVKPKNEQNLTAMVKRLMAKQKRAAGNGNLVIPADFIAEDLKKVGRKESNFAGLHRKLFSGGGKGRGDVGSGEKKLALTEVKANTRSLAMVLRSERELLSQCKDQEGEIDELKLVVEEKNREVEKLKDLCLKQREEIKALKSAILFPDVMNSQLQELLEKQGSELKQAKQLIPSLQEQVTSLTGQLQWLAEDLKEVKADKYSMRGCYDAHVSSPETPRDDHEEAVNSLEFSSGYHTTPGTPDDMFVKDLNPCLTPYYATAKSKEFEAMEYSPPQDRFLRKNMQLSHENGLDSCVGKLSKSSDCCHCHNSGKTSAEATHRSDEIKCTYGKKMNQLFL